MQTSAPAFSDPAGTGQGATLLSQQSSPAAPWPGWTTSLTHPGLWLLPRLPLQLAPETLSEQKASAPPSSSGKACGRATLRSLQSEGPPSGPKAVSPLQRELETLLSQARDPGPGGAQTCLGCRQVSDGGWGASVYCLQGCSS